MSRFRPDAANRRLAPGLNSMPWTAAIGVLVASALTLAVVVGGASGPREADGAAATHDRRQAHEGPRRLCVSSCPWW